MLPSLYKMAGERVPAVIHVASRQVANAVLNIKCDHSDLNLARQSVNVILHSKNAKYAEIDALASYLIANVLKIPIIHAYDGFLSSDEATKFKVLTSNEILEVYKEFEN